MQATFYQLHSSTRPVLCMSKHIVKNLSLHSISIIKSEEARSTHQFRNRNVHKHIRSSSATNQQESLHTYKNFTQTKMIHKYNQSSKRSHKLSISNTLTIPIQQKKNTKSKNGKKAIETTEKDEHIGLQHLLPDIRPPGPLADSKIVTEMPFLPAKFDAQTAPET